MKSYLLALILLAWATVVAAQSQTETIRKTGSFKNANGSRVLSVENIQGFVRIESYNGDQIELVAEKIISAKNQDDTAKGLREVEVKLTETADSIYVLVEAPFIFRKKGNSRNIRINLDDLEYEYKVDMTLRVPANINLNVATVNNGDVTLSNVTGDIKARNVNGPIKLTGTTGKADVSTVNGRIDVLFARNPTADCRFKTINGNVNVQYAPQLNASVSFKSMNGQFYTDLSEVEMMPVRVIKNSETAGGGTVYKIDKRQSYKVGNGGPALTFETLNGNIYLKKN